MNNKDHTSSTFDSELEEIRSSVMQMAALVEQQTQNAINALINDDVVLMDAIIAADHQVKAMEAMIDEISVRIVARRQPTASDLRFVMTVVKTIADLERIGEEAEKIARMAKLLALKNGQDLPRFHEIKEAADTAMLMLRKAIRAFADFDVELAAQVAYLDDEVDERFRVVARRLVAYMIEDPRTISNSLAVLTIIKAIERVGDHAENISEYVIYMVKGRDVRHLSQAEMERGI
jgi:phosphate transport system protein